MIFLVQFGMNKHSQIFQRLQIALALRARAIFCSQFIHDSESYIEDLTVDSTLKYF